jgi:alpha-glucoside transport system permease protein
LAVVTPPAGPAASEVPPGGGGAKWRRWAVAGLFLLPAAIMLGVWVVYPAISTIRRSFYDRDGANFIGLDNFKELFTSDTLLTAIKNNAIWVAVVPAFVTALGLIFAVLTERVRWSVAFKTVVFMPMAISLFAAGVIWHIMLLKDPNQGAVNAAIGRVVDRVSPPGVLSDAQPSSNALTGSASSGLTLAKPIRTGGVAPMGLTGIPPSEVPVDATRAVLPTGKPGAIQGVVWRDFRPGGGTPGKVEKGELGIPGVKVSVTSVEGGSGGSATTAPDGTFSVEGLQPGLYRTSISSDTFAEPFGGIDWLGPDLITLSCIVAYIWVWAGFSMVVIGAGLAALPRDLLEAARTDGASEWQVFRRITIPLLAPVLSVVFITMIINVLKVFDIVLSVAPGSSQDDANVIALAMWRTAFSGVNDFGLGSAIATFLFVLVIPVLLLNVRRFRRDTA